MLTLYEPKYEDLWFRQMMLADEETMSYKHGVVRYHGLKKNGWTGMIIGLQTPTVNDITDT